MNGERSENVARARLIAEGRLTFLFSIREYSVHEKEIRRQILGEEEARYETPGWAFLDVHAVLFR